MYFFIQFFLIRPSVSSYLVLVNSSISSQSRNVLFSWWVTAMKDIYQRNRRLRMVGVIWHQDLRLTDISIIIYNGCCTTALITGFIISLSSNFHLFPILSIGKDHPEFIWSTCAAKFNDVVLFRSMHQRDRCTMITCYLLFKQWISSKLRDIALQCQCNITLAVLRVHLKRIYCIRQHGGKAMLWLYMSTALILIAGRDISRHREHWH